MPQIVDGRSAITSYFPNRMVIMLLLGCGNRLTKMKKGNITHFARWIFYYIIKAHDHALHLFCGHGFRRWKMIRLGWKCVYCELEMRENVKHTFSSIHPKKGGWGIEGRLCRARGLHETKKITLWNMSWDKSGNYDDLFLGHHSISNGVVIYPKMFCHLSSYGPSLDCQTFTAFLQVVLSCCCMTC